MSIASLSSHKKILNATKANLVERVGFAPKATEISVSITGGMAQSAARSMHVSELTLGAQIGSDVVLLDEGVADIHAKLRLERSAFGTLVHIEALGGPVDIDGQTLAMGDTKDETLLPVTLGLGSATLLIDKPASRMAGVVGKSAKVRRFDPVILMSLAGLVAVLLFGFLWPLLERNNQYTIDINTPQYEQQVAMVPSTDWEKQFEIQARDLGLSEVVSASLVSEGILRVEGQLPEGKIQEYRALQAWYDGQLDPPSAIWAVQQRAQLGKMPNIAMVRFSEPAAVILKSGSVITLGEEVSEGWVLDAISDNTLSLVRDTETQIIEFRAALQ
ncbi:MAG: FHA domain-containing protein [Pseudomonadota bacterium]